MKIGEKIKLRRTEKGWSLQDLADRMGYANRSSIARIESGEIDPPQSKVVKFADALGTSVADLMGWEKIQKNNDTITDAVVRMRSDEEFLSVVGGLLTLDADKLSAVKKLLSVL